MLLGSLISQGLLTPWTDSVFSLTEGFVGGGVNKRAATAPLLLRGSKTEL